MVCFPTSCLILQHPRAKNQEAQARAACHENLEMRLVAKGCMRAIYITSPIFFSTAHCCYYCHHSAMMQCLLLILILSMPVVKTNVWKQRATDASLWLCIAGYLGWLELTAHWASNLTTPKTDGDHSSLGNGNHLCSIRFAPPLPIEFAPPHSEAVYWWFRLFFSCQENHFTGWQTLAFSLWQCTVRTLRGTVHRIPLRPCPSMWTTSSRARLSTEGPTESSLSFTDGTPNEVQCTRVKQKKRMERCTVKKFLPLLSKAFYLGTPTTAALVLWFCSSLGKFVYGTILCVILWLRVGLLAFVCIEFILVESKTENRANSSVCPYQKATESN